MSILTNVSQPKEKIKCADVWEHNAEEKDWNYKQDVTGDKGAFKEEDISRSVLFILLYYDGRLKGYVTREKNTRRGEN